MNVEQKRYIHLSIRRSSTPDLDELYGLVNFFWTPSFTFIDLRTK